MKIDAQRAERVGRRGEDRSVTAAAGQAVSKPGDNSLDRLQHKIRVPEIDFVVIKRNPTDELWPAGWTRLISDRWCRGKDVANIRRGVDTVIVVAEFEAESRLRIDRQGEAVVAVMLAMEDVAHIISALEHVYET